MHKNASEISYSGQQKSRGVQVVISNSNNSMFYGHQRIWASMWQVLLSIGTNIYSTSAIEPSYCIGLFLIQILLPVSKHLLPNCKKIA